MFKTGNSDKREYGTFIRGHENPPVEPGKDNLPTQLPSKQPQPPPPPPHTHVKQPPPIPQGRYIDNPEHMPKPALPAPLANALQVAHVASSSTGPVQNAIIANVLGKLPLKRKRFVVLTFFSTIKGQKIIHVVCVFPINLHTCQLSLF